MSTYIEQAFEQKFFGKYKGYVRDNNDPERRGRLRVYCPQVMGPHDDPDHWLGWAEPCFPWLGGLSTLDFGVPPIPDDNDNEHVGVWVEFEGGKVDFPIWVGAFVYAPTVDGVHTQVDNNTVASKSGGSLFQAVRDGLVPGTSADDIEGFDPVRPSKAKEIRLVAKAGTDIVIMSDRGGSIVVGPNGVNIQGTFARVNGRLIDADLAHIVG